MPEKSVDELRKERDEASENLKLLLNRTRPKGLKDGLTTGTSNIVQGAVGAAGLAVIGPTVGLAMGLKHGGLLGGVVGVTAGAIGGAVGAVAMALGGTSRCLCVLVQEDLSMHPFDVCVPAFVRACVCACEG